MVEHRIAFRTDASSQIGTGHFMRCLTLAEGLKQCGAQIRFVCRDLPDHLRDMLAAREMELLPLPTCAPSVPAGDLPHAHWLCVAQEQDAQATIQALAGQFYDWLVVDHYALDARWEAGLRASARRIMVIDDLADRQHDCDVLLDQNFYADMQTRYTGKVPLQCQLLLGPRYALLRDEFRQLRMQVRPRTGSVKRVLVFFGGVDTDNFTGRAIEALSEIDRVGLHIDVVIGAQHPSREQIKAACAQHGFICHVQTDKMAELMAAADLSIGAGGSSTWERCAMGLPALSICVAENQRKQIADAAEVGMLYAPSTGDDLALFFKRHIEALLENAPLLRHISRAAMNAVDGRGAFRAAATLGLSGIEIRTANENDTQKLFGWRNHQTIRAMSRNPALITWKDHQSWFAAVMSDSDRVLLIGYRGEQAIGVVRCDIQGETGEISIYLVPEGGFSGLGQGLLLSAEHWLKLNRPDIKRIRASVLAGNEPSQRLFLSANYRLESNCYSKELQSEGMLK